MEHRTHTHPHPLATVMLCRHRRRHVAIFLLCNLLLLCPENSVDAQPEGEKRQWGGNRCARLCASVSPEVEWIFNFYDVHSCHEKVDGFWRDLKLHFSCCSVYSKIYIHLSMNVCERTCIWHAPRYSMWTYWLCCSARLRCVHCMLFNIHIAVECHSSKWCRETVGAFVPSNVRRGHAFRHFLSQFLMAMSTADVEHGRIAQLALQYSKHELLEGIKIPVKCFQRSNFN